MKRIVRVVAKTDSGDVTANVEINFDGLTRDEMQFMLDQVTENVVGAVRDLPYLGRIPLRNVYIS